MELIIKAILNIGSVLPVYILNVTFLGTPNKPKITVGICYAIFYFIITFTYLYIGLPYIMSLSLILGLTGVSFIHSNHIKKNMSIAILIFGILILTENVTVATFIKGNLNYFEKVKHDTLAILSVSKFLTLLVSIFIYSFYSRRFDVILPTKYYFVLPSIIFLSAILTTFLLVTYDLSSINISISVILLIIINYVSFSMYNEIINLFIDKTDAASLQKQYDLIKIQNENIEKSADKLRRLEHDLKNKLTPIAFMVKDENMTQISGYLQDIMAEFSTETILKSCGINELDGILNMKMNKCEDLKIVVEHEISHIKNPVLNNMDLAVIVGILLDNAIEATSKVNKKKIKMDIRSVKGVLIIEIENTFEGMVIKKRNRFMTRKKNKEFHGMGIKNIENILEKYDGEIKLNYSGNIFKSLVIVYSK